MFNKRFFVFFISAAFLLLILEGFLVFFSMSRAPRFDSAPFSDTRVSSPNSPEPGKEPDKDAPAEQSIFYKVPFTSQAPSANWDNIIFQQGCEEASMLMAMLWVQGKSFIGVKEAEKAITAISGFSQKNYGEFRDTSAKDTAAIMRAYFDYENVKLKNDITLEDIKGELANGNLVIVPVNGQKIGNPFYTPPGPIQHMLVVRGYDADKKEFITNDPGTRRGEAFRYGEDVLDMALEDYVTGYKEPILEVRKVMIVVGAD